MTILPTEKLDDEFCWQTNKVPRLIATVFRSRQESNGTFPVAMDEGGIRK